MDRCATLLFPPAVALPTLAVATVLAMVKRWGRIRAAALQECNGDESRRGS
ncbi:MAG: hypothetical protein ACRD2W_22805 [Acidimicrobiales bacterium]